MGSVILVMMAVMMVAMMGGMAWGVELRPSCMVSCRGAPLPGQDARATTLTMLMGPVLVERVRHPADFRQKNVSTAWRTAAPAA